MKKRFLLALILPVFGALTAALSGLLMPQTVYAADGTWINKSTIEISGRRYIDNKPDDSNREFFLDGKDRPGECSEVIRDFDGDRSATLYRLNTGASLRTRDCRSGIATSSEPVTLSSSDKASLGAGADASDEPTCESNGGDMSWLLCPVLRQLDNVVGYLDEQINYLLAIPSGYYQQTRLRDTWGSLRNIALLVLVPIMLIMVISTALGFDFVSAYSVKKAMPRFLAAVLFITLSWPITVFIVEVVNAIGKGIGGLMAAPFGGLNSITLNSLFNSNAGADAGAGILLGIIGVGAISVVSISVILSFLAMAALGLFVGYVLLVLRQFLVLALMLLAPLAILSWIFPGNDKLWKSWWGTFSKLLLLFPLVIILITAGRIFAKIVQETPGDVAGPDGFAATLIKLIAYVGPYFFIPAVFKFAGGVFATVAGIANDKERGLFDRQKKYRARKMGENLAGAKAGNRFQGKRWLPGSTTLAKGYNRASVGLGTGFKGNFGIGGRGREAVDQTRRNAMMDLMKTPGFQAVQDDDGALRAATYSTAADALKNMGTDFGMEQGDVKRAVQAVQTSIGFGRPQQIAAAQQLVNTGTGYSGHDVKDENGNVIGHANALEEMAQTLARASGGNASTASSLAGFSNYQAKSKGRFDLAPGYGSLNNLVRQRAGIALGPGEAPISLDKANIEAWKAGSTYQLAQGKSQQMKPLVETWQKHLNTALATGNQEQLRESITAFEEMKQIIPNTSGTNADILNKALDGYNIGMGRLQEQVGKQQTYMGIDEQTLTAVVEEGRSRVRRYDPYEDQRRRAGEAVLGPPGPTGT